MYDLFLMAKVTTLLRVRQGTRRALSTFQKEWHVLQKDCYKWELNKIKTDRYARTYLRLVMEAKLKIHKYVYVKQFMFIADTCIAILALQYCKEG